MHVDEVQFYILVVVTDDTGRVTVNKVVLVLRREMIEEETRG